MARWIDVREEIAKAGKKKGVEADFDGVRREAYSKLAALTGRPLIVYASAFHVPLKNQAAAAMLSIDQADKEGFEEVVQNLEGDAVDVFVHSPGGSPEATESIVAILRSKFSDVRFIVTGSAKSAATMLVMSGNSILMSIGGELGPTDPQEFVGDARPSPAGAILEQFELGKREVSKDPNLIGGWVPILQKYGPSLLVECANHIELAETLVSGWLAKYMFSDDKDANQKASKLASYLADHSNFLSHGRRVDFQMIKEQGAKVVRVEDQAQDIRDAIQKVHLTVMATLDSTAAVKIFENSEGGALIRLVNIEPVRPNEPENPKAKPKKVPRRRK